MVEIRRAEARDLRAREGEFHVAAKPVVRPDIGEYVAERMQFPRPIAGRPATAAEMADRMRADLMAAAIKLVDVIDALPHIVGGAAEPDPRCAARLSGRLVEIAIAVGNEIDAADEEGEMQPVAVSVHLGGKRSELLPAFELGAIIECDLDELRRPFDRARLGARNEENQDREKSPPHRRV